MSTVRAAEEFLQNNPQWQDIPLDGDVLHQVVCEYETWRQQRVVEVKQEQHLAQKAVRDRFNKIAQRYQAPDDGPEMF
jgi:hypothetical protein